MSYWQVGDKAVCINAAGNPFYPEQTPLHRDQTYTVVHVHLGEGALCLHCDDGCDGLRLAEAITEAELGFSGCRFRKVRPDKHEACEEEFVTLLRKSKVSA